MLVKSLAVSCFYIGLMRQEALHCGQHCCLIQLSKPFQIFKSRFGEIDFVSGHVLVLRKVTHISHKTIRPMLGLEKLV